MKRVLVVNPFGIGDVIFSMALVEAVRKNFPSAFIGFLCNERTEGLVRLNPSIDRVFVFNRDRFRNLLRSNLFRFWGELGNLWREVGRERFEALFDLSLGRQYSFAAMLLGIGKRIGFDFKGRGVFLTHKKRIEGYAGRHVTDIQLELLKMGGGGEGVSLRIPFVIPLSARKFAEELLRERGFRRALAVAPGGGRSWGEKAVYKQWNPERFAEAANKTAKNGDCGVLLLGEKAEKDLLERTAGFLERPCAVVCGEPIERVCAFLLRSELLLCNDGGLLHLANVLGVKTVSIFGPVDEKVYGPYDRSVLAKVVTEPVPCRPCYRNFRFPPCSNERRCLELLTVERVVEAVGL
ncbi:MAG: glycosyltransferase family 9 protein [Candidatus Omnitrophica bacterium]|nr:glycosyltransferase family 9 protein [Candidatus Omnitrophota bacterium]